MQKKVYATEWEPLQAVTVASDTTAAGNDAATAEVSGADTESTLAVTASGTAEAVAAVLDKPQTANVEREALEASVVEKPVPNAYINDYFGFSRTDLVEYLVENVNTYLGTPYQDKMIGTPIPGAQGGMDCQGFVWTALVAVATEHQENVPCGIIQTVPANGGGWVNWAYNMGIYPLSFGSKEEMLSSGVLEKGDIIWSFDVGGHLALSSYNHVGFFWGDTPTDDKMWHSAPQTGDTVYAGEDGKNRITPIISMSKNPSEWWVFKLSKDRKYRYAIWEGRPLSDLQKEEALEMPENDETIRVDISSP